MRNLAVIFIFLMLSGCDGFGFNRDEDTVQSFPDLGRSLIEQNLWHKAFPIRRGDPTLYDYVLKIDRETWKINVLDLEVGGNVSWNKNRIIFHNSFGDVFEECNIDGIYVYEIKLSEDERIVLNLLREEDPCPRTAYLSGWWWKVDSND